MSLYSRIHNWVAGEVLTASDLNAEFNNILANSISDSVVGTSVNVSAMQTTVSPGAAGSESLASNVTGELQRLRYVIQRMGGGALWYTAPLRNLTAQITSADIASATIATGNLIDGIITLVKLNAEVTPYLVPSGCILPSGSTSIPAGWLYCDGSSILRATYPTLFTSIGTAFGTVDGTHFNLPDLRGRFLRGVADTSGYDVDTASRVASQAGGNTGNAVGSYQDDGIKSHTHSISTASSRTVTTGFAFSASGGTNDFTAASTSGSTGVSDTHPKNVYVNYIIKI